MGEITETFLVEKGVPYREMNRFRPKSKYPYGTMEIGDSFFVAGPPRKTYMRLLSAANHYRRRKQQEHKRFSARYVVDESGTEGVRIWRLE